MSYRAELIKKLKPGPLGHVISIRLCQLFVVFIHFLWCQRKRASCDLPHHYRKAPVSFGSSDSIALLKAAGILKTRGVYTPLRGAQTV